MIPDMIDTNFLMIVLVVITAILGISLLIFLIYRLLRTRNKISTRLDQFVAPEPSAAGAEKARPIVPREISGSLFQRTVVNWVNKLLEFLGRYAPARMAANMEHKLTVAGNPGNLRATTFFALRLLALMGGVFLAYQLNNDIETITSTSLLLGVLVIVISILFPISWLNGRVRKRQDEIERQLPDALDMLSVCASAGLGFDQSLQKISDSWDTEFGHEIKRATEEMKMGISREEALRNMSQRLDVDNLTRFVAIIVQAEKVGMSYADVLHSQALQMRVLRQLRAREIANKLPGKMILPIGIFIFPAILAVILGPAIPVLLDVF